MDDYKRMKSEVEIRNGNGKIDKSECKISTAGKSEDASSIHIAILLYSYQYVYTAILIYVLPHGWLNEWPIFSPCCYMLSYRRTNKRESGRADFLACAKKQEPFLTQKPPRCRKKVLKTLI